MILKFLSKKFYISFLIVALIYFIDRLSKIYIIQLDENNLGSDIFNSAYLNIVLIWNKGIAFGLLSFTESYFNSSDEFLVEKKSPLVMPPSYGELPVPSNEKTNIENQANKIESLISKKKETKKLENVDLDKNFEESILDEIKNN
jgi:hypothetical protein